MSPKTPQPPERPERERRERDTKKPMFGFGIEVTDCDYHVVLEAYLWGTLPPQGIAGDLIASAVVYEM